MNHPHASLCFLFLLFAAAAAHGATIYVPDDYPRIQEAIDASAGGDTIVVRAGTYVENIDFMGKGITVKSESGPDATTIDGNQAGAVVAFDKGEGADSMLQGFTVTNGSESGIYCYGSSPEIRENRVIANSWMWGGGIYCQNGDPLITDCLIRDNLATDSGGGIYCRDSAAVIDGNSIICNELTGIYKEGGGIACYNSSPIIARNHISGNTADYGGGISCSLGSPDIYRNCITENTAQSQGGGIYCAADPRIKENEVIKNSAYWSGGGIYLCTYHSIVHENIITENSTSTMGGGGGISCNSGSYYLARNKISKNMAGQHGGGIYCPYDTDLTLLNDCIFQNSAGIHGGGLYTENSYSTVMINCLVWGNNAGDCGGGFYNRDRCESTIINSTICSNSASEYGGGLYTLENSYMSVINTILWNNSSPNGPAIHIGNPKHPSTVDIAFSDVEGGQAAVFVKNGSTLNWGDGMIDADPLFVDAAGGDFHIPFDSPCRSAGDRLAPRLPEIDFEGDSRTGLFAYPDIGADEFHTHFYISGPVVSGSSARGVIVGWPKTNPVLLLSGSGVCAAPHGTPYGDFWLLPPWNGRAHFNAMPDNGVRIIDRIVNASFPPGTEIPFQALVGTELSNLWIAAFE